MVDVIVNANDRVNDRVNDHINDHINDRCQSTSLHDSMPLHDKIYQEIQLIKHTIEFINATDRLEI